jgi:hypothetical protein
MAAMFEGVVLVAMKKFGNNNQEKQVMQQQRK